MLKNNCILTSSVSCLSCPISSGMETSLLLLAIRTFSGRLQRCTGNVESWFRLFGQKENQIIRTIMRSHLLSSHTKSTRCFVYQLSFCIITIKLLPQSLYSSLKQHCFMCLCLSTLWISSTKHVLMLLNSVLGNMTFLGAADNSPPKSQQRGSAAGECIQSATEKVTRYSIRNTLEIFSKSRGSRISVRWTWLLQNPICTFHNRLLLKQIGGHMMRLQPQMRITQDKNGL